MWPFTGLNPNMNGLVCYRVMKHDTDGNWTVPIGAVEFGVRDPNVQDVCSEVVELDE